LLCKEELIASMFPLVYIIVLLVIVSTFCYRWRYRKFYKLYEKIPQVHDNFPLIGIAWKCFSLDPKNIYNLTCSVLATGPSPRRLNIGPACAVVVDDPEQVQKVLLSRISINKISMAKLIPVKSGKS
jgi:hypothetical protein